MWASEGELRLFLLSGDQKKRIDKLDESDVQSSAHVENQESVQPSGFAFQLNRFVFLSRSTPPPLPEVFNKTDDDKKDNTQIAS